MDGASWIADWWAWALPATLQATVLLGLAWLADRVFVRRAWPQLLVLLWFVALVRFVVPPDLGSPLSVTAALGAPTLAAAKLAPSAVTLVLAFTLWLAGALVAIAIRVAQRVRLSASVRPVSLSSDWSRALERAALALGCRVPRRIGTLDGLATPAVFGLFRPTLLLPRAWLARAPSRRDQHALLHELAHLKRADLWVDELCAAMRALVWFHPLAWIAVERIHTLGELQCDQVVARVLGHDARSYRETLILAARQLVERPAPRGVRAFLGHPSAIIVRIERLERAATRSLALVRSVSAAVAFALAACVLPMAPRSDDLRARAREVFAAEKRGEMQSCFTLQAAAMVLADETGSPKR